MGCHRDEGYEKEIGPSAVSRMGAVSPAERARASRIPVASPPFPVLITTLSTVFHLGIPSAIEASRRVTGTIFSDSSVVLAIIGIIMIDRDTPPATAENVFVVRTMRI